MYSKDFILRMIEMIGDLIAGILGLIKKGDFQLASQTLENAYFDFLKKDASFFRAINKEKLIEELTKKNSFTDGHLEILSELFFADAEILYAQGKQTASIEFYEKSIILLDYVINSSNTMSFEKQNKLLALQNKLTEIMGNAS
jgi:hypothetical protein